MNAEIAPAQVWMDLVGVSVETELLYVTGGLISIAVLLLLLYAAIFLVAGMCERRYLAGQFEPVRGPFPYQPSPYWTATREAAVQQGWHHAGDFATRRKTAKLKGLLSLFISPDWFVLAAIYSGAFGGAKLKKTILLTTLSSGRVLESADTGDVSDPSGVVAGAILFHAGIAELGAFHSKRTWETGAIPSAFSMEAALPEFERLALQKGQRWVMLGFARWVDPEHTVIRLTFRGAWALLRATHQQVRKMGEQAHRAHIRRAGS